MRQKGYEIRFFKVHIFLFPQYPLFESLILLFFERINLPDISYGLKVTSVKTF